MLYSGPGCPCQRSHAAFTLISGCIHSLPTDSIKEGRLSVELLAIVWRVWGMETHKVFSDGFLEYNGFGMPSLCSKAMALLLPCHFTLPIN